MSVDKLNSAKQNVQENYLASIFLFKFELETKNVLGIIPTNLAISINQLNNNRSINKKLINQSINQITINKLNIN